MYKYLKPPFPRYHPPYPVMFTEVPTMNYNQLYGIPYTREQLYGAKLVNSPYLYEDPYTTIAEDDLALGSFNRESRQQRRAARRSAREQRRIERRTRRDQRRAQRRGTSTSTPSTADLVRAGGSPTPQMYYKPAGGQKFNVSILNVGMKAAGSPLAQAKYIADNASTIASQQPIRKTAFFAQQAVAQSGGFKPMIPIIAPQLQSEAQAVSDAGKAQKTSNTMVIAGVSVLALALLGGGGFMYYRSRQKNEGTQNIIPQYYY